MTTRDAWYARAFDATYLEVYAHRDAEEAERATRALLEPLGLAHLRVLDLACGAGRYMTALGRCGARVVGVDLSVPLLRAALHATRRRPGVLGLVRGDMLRLPFRVASYDIVLSMFTSFGYFVSENEDRAVLAGIARVLRPGGRLVLDLFNAERVRRDLVPETHRKAGRFDVHERRHVDAARHTVVKEIELRDGDERHRYREEVRLWTSAALEEALEQAGFDVEQRWGGYDGEAHDPQQSERLIVCARRRPQR
ncbi:MAG: class I SAM-dependent methyltransferase [Candidatus Krumholzibacteriia bacterium]